MLTVFRSAPIAWFPRLANATQKEKDNWRLIAKGQTIIREPKIF